MPALPPVPAVLKVEFDHTYGVDPHLTSRSFWHYTGGAPSNGDCNTLATSAATLWATHIAALAPTAVTLVGVTITDLTSPTAGVGSATVSHAGTRSGTAMTINDVVNLGFKIGRRYRGGKPKMFGPWGVQEDLFEPNQWGSSFITAVNTAWTAFNNDWVTVSAGATNISDQVNVSYYHGFASVQNPITLRWRNIPTPRTSVTPDAITGHAASSFVGSQRRRIRA